MEGENRNMDGITKLREEKIQPEKVRRNSALPLPAGLVINRNNEITNNQTQLNQRLFKCENNDQSLNPII